MNTLNAFKYINKKNLYLFEFKILCIIFAILYLLSTKLLCAQISPAFLLHMFT